MDEQFICEYLDITPMEFFNEEKSTTLIQQKAIEHIYTILNKTGNYP